VTYFLSWKSKPTMEPYTFSHAEQCVGCGAFIQAKEDLAACKASSSTAQNILVAAGVAIVLYLAFSYLADPPAATELSDDDDDDDE
jgi:hypothetical protein